MNKYAQEKIAQEYYQLGIELALQNAGMGMSKTASKNSQLAKLLGIGAGGVGLGALGMRMATPAQESAAALLGKMAPLEYLKAMGQGAGNRLGALDDVSHQMVQRLHNLENPDLYDRLAMTGQALKPSNLFSGDTLGALKLMGQDALQGVQDAGGEIIGKAMTLGN